MKQSGPSSIFILSWIICVSSSFQQEKNTPTKFESPIRHRHSCNGGKSLAASVCLPKGYNLGEVPTIPIEVLTIFEINNIREINDKKMTVTFEFYQEMTWIDNRIQTNFSEDVMKLGGMPLTSNQLKHIWTPGLWVQSLFDFKLRSVFEPSVGLYVHRKTKCQLINCNETSETDDGDLQTAVTFNFEARATIFCNFAYFRYPLDTQTCDFVMSSAYPFPDIVVFRLEHAEFGTTFNNSNTDDFVLDIKFNSIHNGFSGISFVLTLQRRLLPYIMRYYLPCVAMVIVSFINFLISLNSIPARVALLVTLFLTVTNILIAQQADSPASGNFTALGIYLCTCLFFVVASFIELAVLLALKNNHRIKGRRRMVIKSTENETKVERNVEEEFAHYIYKIDVVSLFIFACMFGIFNIFYWYRFGMENEN